MASSLSEEEFERLQKQLIDLRTSNYQFEETCRKQQNELNIFRDKCEILDRDLLKANRAVNKSKKAKEFELLMEENNILQSKLHSQEDDFRLQTTTIMQELTTLVSANEQLEKENEELKNNGNKMNSDSEVHAELRRVLAQNSALQKNLNDCQNNYENEMIGLKENILKLTELNAELELRCMKLSGQRGTPAGGDNENEVPLDQRTVEGENTREDHFEDPLGCYNPLKDGHNTSMIELMKQSDSRIELQLKELIDVKLQLDTEKEENKILKEDLEMYKKSHDQKITGLQEEVLKLSEKLKKKQESLLQLQDEKEQMYSERQKYHDDFQLKETEIERLSEQLSRLDSELTHTKQNLDECLEQSGQRIQELEADISSLQSLVDSHSDDQVLHLSAENSQLLEQISKGQETLQDIMTEQESLKVQLQKSNETNSELKNQTEELLSQNEQLAQNLDEVRRVADKRKSLLDEMDVHLQKTVNQHLDDTASLRSELTKKIDELRGQLAIEKERSSEFEQCKEQLKDLEGQLQSSEGVKGWLQRRLNESEEELLKAKDDFEHTLQTYQQEHFENLAALERQHKEHLAVKQAELEELHRSSEQLLQTISKLKQDAKDSVEDRKIHDKKGASMLKDMKRQLHSERRRAEKLQEKLDEFLTEHNKSKQSVEDLFRPIDPADRQRGDNSSVSSYSGLGSKDTNHLSPSDTPPMVLEQENNDLLARIASVQEEKWILEEKVSHLETSNAAMAEDIMSKTAIIEHYCMEKRGDFHHPSVHNPEKLTLKRVVDFVNNRGDENLKEINRKLQRMLEETLTKNMHLQKDLDTMAQQIGKPRSDVHVGAS